jgi:hypothetical protein
MTLEEALEIADKAVLEIADKAVYDRGKKRKHLTDTQRKIFKESWEGKTYQEIAEICQNSFSHIDNEGAALWQLLSEALGEKVTKKNFQGAIERYKQSRCSTVNPSPTLLPLAFPIQSSSGEDEIKENNQKERRDVIGHMQTSITLDGNGCLKGTTRTWTNREIQGFHGSVTVRIVDKNNHILWESKSVEYGVNGILLAKGARLVRLPEEMASESDRTEEWKSPEPVPLEVLNQMSNCEIIHRHSPRR